MYGTLLAPRALFITHSLLYLYHSLLNIYDGKS